MKNKAVLEGLLFVVGEDGLSLKQIEDVLESLGYSMKDTTRTSYLSMLMKKDKDDRDAQSNGIY